MVSMLNFNMYNDEKTIYISYSFYISSFIGSMWDFLNLEPLDRVSKEYLFETPQGKDSDGGFIQQFAYEDFVYRLPVVLISILAEAALVMAAGPWHQTVMRQLFMVQVDIPVVLHQAWPGIGIIQVSDISTSSWLILII